MKKLLTLAMAGCFILGSLGVASAIDVKVNGQWEFHYGYYSHGNLMKADEVGKQEDRLRFRHRSRTQVRFIADETLSAMLNIEIGQNLWGDTSTSAGMDADGKDVKVKWMYLDWTLPGTQVKTRMGTQPYALPGFVAGNPILDADMTGITVSTNFTPEIGLTAFWARPFDAGINDSPEDNKWDEMDVFGIIVPIKTSSIRVSPWVMGAIIGNKSQYWEGPALGYGWNDKEKGRGRPFVNPSKVDSDVYAYWFGASFEAPVLDPFIAKIDAWAGGLKTGDSDSDTFGYMIVGQVGYKFDFGKLSAIGWYASGDDKNDDRGIMPILSNDTGFTPTMSGTDGGRWRSYDNWLSSTGTGMWAIGLELADVSFVDKLSHTVRGFYYRGTNSGEAVANGADYHAGYLLTTDWAWEVNLMNEYKVNENLTLALDFSYLDLNLSKQHANEDMTHGNFSTQIGVRYAF